MKIIEPKTTQEKTKLARKLYEEFKGIRDGKDIATWFEGELLYYFDKFGLHNYLFGKALSKNAFYAEIDIPTSTANFKIDLYKFYIGYHKFTIGELKEANTKKLHRAIPLIRNKTRKEVEEVIGWAEREKQSLYDFLVNCGLAEKDYCVQHEPEEIKSLKCKKCGKQIK